MKNLDSGKLARWGLWVLVRPNKRQPVVSTYYKHTYIFFANLEHGQEQKQKIQFKIVDDANKKYS